MDVVVREIRNEDPCNVRNTNLQLLVCVLKLLDWSTLEKYKLKHLEEVCEDITDAAIDIVSGQDPGLDKIVELQTLHVDHVVKMLKQHVPN